MRGEEEDIVLVDRRIKCLRTDNFGREDFVVKSAVARTKIVKIVRWIRGDFILIHWRKEFLSSRGGEIVSPGFGRRDLGCVTN